MIRLLKILLVVCLVNVSCSKDDEIVMPDEPIIENPDSIGLEICESIKNGEIIFEYRDSTYYYTNLEIHVSVDTLFSDTIRFYRKYIIFDAPLDDKKDMVITIIDIETPNSDCITTREYFEFNDNEFESNYCVSLPDSLYFGIPCSYSTITIRTKGNGSTSFTYAVKGSLKITNCTNGAITGDFENTYFKNGKFCRLQLE